MSTDIITSNGGPAGYLAKPVNVISDTLREYADGLRAQAAAYATAPITDPEGMKAAVELLNSLHKTAKAMDDQRLEAGAPFRQVIAEIDAQVKPMVAATNESKLAINRAMQDYDRREREARARAEAEKQAKRLEAERLEREAAARQEVAAEHLDKARGEAGFERAAQEFEKGVATGKAALQSNIDAMNTPTPELTKAKGVRAVLKVTSLQVTDLAKLPLAYHTADEAKIKRHIIDGTLDHTTPGISFTIEKVFSGSGR